MVLAASGTYDKSPSGRSSNCTSPSWASPARASAARCLASAGPGSLPPAAPSVATTRCNPSPRDAAAANRPYIKISKSSGCAPMAIICMSNPPFESCESLLISH